MIETIHWHTLHPRYLSANSRVLDLGANYGMFTDAIVQRFGCQCVAVEPSPVPFAAIRTGPRVSKLCTAVSNYSGMTEFHVAEESTRSSLISGPTNNVVQVPVTTLPDLIRNLGWDRVDLLKVDIEGAEIPMLAECPDELLQRIAQMSVEFHDFNAVTPRSDVRKTLDRLSQLGFCSVRMSRVGHQDTWIVNQKMLGIATSEILFTRWAIRNWFGAKRVMQKFRRPRGAVSRA